MEFFHDMLNKMRKRYRGALQRFDNNIGSMGALADPSIMHRQCAMTPSLPAEILRRIENSWVMKHIFCGKTVEMRAKSNE